MESVRGENFPGEVGTSFSFQRSHGRPWGRIGCTEAEPFARKALELGKAEFGTDHPTHADLVYNLAGPYESQGRYSEAEPLHERALAI